MSTSKKTSPDWLERITKLRTELGLDQAGFAEKLGLTPAAVSGWNGGHKEPSVETYIRMAHLASRVQQGGNAEVDPLWFWERAGIDLQAMQYLIPEIGQRFKRFEKRLRVLDEAISIPVLRSFNSLRKPLLADDEIADRLTVDSAYIPASARACVVPEQKYSVLFPAAGDIVIVDSSLVIDASNAPQIETLANRLVVALVEYGPGAFDSLSFTPPGLWIGELRFNPFATAYGGDDREARIHMNDRQPLIGRKTIVRKDEFGKVLSGETDFTLFSFVKFVAPILQWIRSGEDRKEKKPKND